MKLKFLPILLFVWSIAFQSNVQAATYTVCASGCDYTTVTAAIAAATAGDNINITDAVHTEQGITIDKNLTINGTHSSGTTVQAHATEGSATDRVFYINSVVTVSINDLVIRHGKSSNADGGGIYNNQGNLTLTNCTISNNSVTSGFVARGGGIANYSGGILTLMNCTISNNSSNGPGGGIANSNSTLTLTNCTISNNSATGGGSGGGITNYSGGTSTLTNCTISNNSTVGSGGGIYNEADLTMTNCTISNNSAGDFGGGIRNSSTLNMVNNIIADNSATNGSPNFRNDGGAAINTKNICEGCTGTWFSTADPGLGTLTDNGGTTQTVAITSPASLAINNGDAAAPAADQRGFTRNATSTIGAWEYCSCDNTNPIPTKTGTYTSACSKVTGDWKDYFDTNGKLLLSLKVGTSGAVIQDDDVQVQIGATNTSTYAQNCGGNCFIDLASGATLFNRQWDVQPETQPSTGEVGVKFYYTQAEFDAVKTEVGGTPINMNEMWFYKNTNGESFPTVPSLEASEVLILTNDATTPATDKWVMGTKTVSNEYFAEYMVSSFSGGGGGGAASGAAPLPIELIYFDATAKGQTAVLQWATASEINNQGFEIERSLDGLSWDRIGYVQGVGNSTNQETYNYLDQNPVTGKNYYRLRQIDMDGKMEILPVRAVEIGLDKAALVNIYPNPVRTFLQVENFQGRATIFDFSGRQILEINLTDESINTIEVGSLENGIYTLELRNELGERVVKRFMK